MAPKPVDPFSIDINLGHPTWDPLRISEALSLEASWSWKGGDRFGSVVKSSSRWYGQLAVGFGAKQYEAALDQVVSFLGGHKAFLAECRESDGEIEIILNCAVLEHPKGKALELYLSPAFLEHLSRFGVGLRVQAWTDNPSWRSNPY
jgi:hypothetical protein